MSIRINVRTLACLGAAVALTVSPTRGTAGKPQPTNDRTILFQSINSTSTVQIQLMRDDGTGVVKINNSSGLEPYLWPRWSPDGTMIGGYYKSLNNDVAIMAMRADGSQEEIVVSEAQFNAFNLARSGVLDSRLMGGGRNRPAPYWLGNGAMIFQAYTQYDPSFFDETDPGYGSEGIRLFIADSGTGLHPLSETALLNAGPYADNRYYDADPHWSPVLDAIVFVSNRSGFDELYSILPDGTGLTQITDFRVPAEYPDEPTLLTPVWDPWGERIAVVVDFTADGYARDLLILDIDLTQPEPGTGAGGRITGVNPFKVSFRPLDESPSWSPSGDRLLFHRYAAAGLSQIVIADVATGAETVIAETQMRETRLVPNILLPDWKPVP